MDRYRPPAADDAADESLGEYPGAYDNTEAAPQLKFHEHGVRFGNETVRYADMQEVLLPNAKESLALMLITSRGPVELAMTGHRDRFYDSLEILRFLKRVQEDLHRSGAPEG